MTAVPKYYFLTSGKGYGEVEVEAFEKALRDAGIEQFNFVRVSSIVPPEAVELKKEEGLKMLSPGEIVYSVMARLCLEPGEEGSVAIGVAIGEGTHGYFVEIEERGPNAGEKAKKVARRLYVSKFQKEPTMVKEVSSYGRNDRDGILCLIAASILI